MEKKLPRIYTNSDNISSNNRKFYYSELKEKNKLEKENKKDNNNYTKEEFLEKYNLRETVKKNNINTKIINIFKHSNSIYKIKVKIKINGKEEEKYLIGRTNTTLITLDGEIINIGDIEDIYVSD